MHVGRVMPPAFLSSQDIIIKTARNVRKDTKMANANDRYCTVYESPQQINQFAMMRGDMMHIIDREHVARVSIRSDGMTYVYIDGSDPDPIALNQEAGRAFIQWLNGTDMDDMFSKWGQ